MEAKLKDEKDELILNEGTAAFLLTLRALHNDDSNNLSRRMSKKGIIGIATRDVIHVIYTYIAAFSAKKKKRKNTRIPFERRHTPRLRAQLTCNFI